ncbi:hypothetical protein [Streptomyces omiyaensis]|uniref:hypothetical protein n=1 Tax=Streptomyces omiyaensis TaxID=68247 RepID=UPI0036F714ED
MTTSAPATGSRVRPVGPHLVITSEETAPALTAALGGLPPLPGALLILAAAQDAAPVLRRSLPDLVALAVERGATSLVLAASGLAATGPDGRRPVEAVAATADFTVIAPDGVVSIEPDGTLRIAEPGSWWSTEPGEQPRRLAADWPPAAGDEAPGRSGRAEPGPGLGEGLGQAGNPDPSEDPGREGRRDGIEEPDREEHPDPSEDPDREGRPDRIAEPDRDKHPDRAEDPLPPPAPPVPMVAESRAGAHGFGAAPVEGAVPVTGAAPVEDEGRSVRGGCWLGDLPEAAEQLIGVHPDAFLLGVGSPRRPSLPTAELLDRVPEAAKDAADLLLAAPWAAPSELIAMAVALAEHLGRTVRAAVGLPVRTADDHATTLLDERAAPTWQPLLLELAASPEHRRVVPSAWLRLPGQDAPAPAVHRSTDLEDWLLESVPAGLWLRPAGPVPDLRPRTLRPDPVRPVLVVGGGDVRIGPEVWAALPWVSAMLPGPGATEPHGLLVHGSEAEEAEGRARATALDLNWLDPRTTWPAPEALSSPEAAPDPEGTPEAGLEPGPGPAAPRVVLGPGAGAPEPDPRAPGPHAWETTPPTERDRQPEPATAPVAPPGPDAPVRAVPVPVPARPVRPAPAPAAPSGPGDRAALRDLLGERYHVLAGRTELLASRLPSLRSTAQDDLKPDMVAIAVYQADTPDPVSRAGLAEAARAAAPGPFTPLLRCLGSGLRRLPGHYGAVMLAAPAEAVPLDRYVPGAVIVEPAAVAAVPACDAELEGAVEFGIWSTTGRRTAVFLGTDDEPEVVFPPGTAFTVLALNIAEDDASPIRVLLREVSPAEGVDSRVRERDAQARARLVDWFERRDMLEPHDRRPLPDASRFHTAPGAAPG